MTNEEARKLTWETALQCATSVEREYTEQVANTGNEDIRREFTARAVGARDVADAIRLTGGQREKTMGKKIELRTALEVLQQEIDFHKDGAPKITMPHPKYAEGFIKGLEYSKELIAKVAEIENG